MTKRAEVERRATKSQAKAVLEAICTVCGEPFEQRTGRGRRYQCCPKHRHPRYSPGLPSSDAERPAVNPHSRYRNQAKKRVIEALGDDAEGRMDAIERYANAVQLERKLYDEWTRLGQPATEFGGTTGRNIVEHPLVQAIARASAAAAKLSEQLGTAKRVGAGRPAGAVSAPDRVAARQRPRLTLAK